VLFDDAGWDDPVLVTIHSVNDGSVQDPHNTTIFQSVVEDIVNGDPAYNAIADHSTQRLDVMVLDDETPGVFLQESGGRTLVAGGNTLTGPGAGDTYTIRLTSQPTADVNIDLVPDGQTDIDVNDLIAAGRISLVATGGLQPTQLFTGNITTSAGAKTITRASGDELGSFIEDGFVPGQRIRIEGAGAGFDGDYYIDSAPGSVTDLTIQLRGDMVIASGTVNDVFINVLQERGGYAGSVEYKPAAMPFLLMTGDLTIAGTTVTRSKGNFINADFAPGQVLRIVKADQTALGDFTISAAPGSVTETTLTLTAAPAAGAYPGGQISKLLDTLRRLDGTSWLDSGFYEGHIVEIDGITASRTASARST
jgi:hypothetical protein